MKLPRPFLLAAAFTAFAPFASAVTLYWDGTSTNADANGGAGTWDTTTSNWDDAPTGGLDVTWLAPSSGDDDAFFGGVAGTVTVDAGGITVNDLTFATSGYTISGGALTLDSLDPDGPDPLPAPLPSITVGATSHTIPATINSAIISPLGLEKKGGSTLNLGGDLSGIGGTIVIDGAITTPANNNSGIAISGTAVVPTSASFDIRNNSYLALAGVTLGSGVSFTINGGGGNQAPQGALRGTSGATVVNGPITINSAGARIGNVGTSTTYNGAITAASASGFGLLIRNGLNQGAILTNTGNYWEGTTDLHDGSYYFHPGALPASSNLLLASSASTWFETNGTFTRPVGSAAGEVRFNATAGRVNGFSARGGALSVDLGGASAPVVWGVANFTPASLGLAGPNATDTTTFLNPIDLNGANRTIDAQQGQADVDGVIPGPISGVAGSILTKTGRGVIELTGPNTYPGGTVIAQSQGAINPLRVSHANALGTGSLTIGAGGNNDQSRLELTGGITVTNAIPALTSRNNFLPFLINVSGDNTLTANISSGGGGSRQSIQSNEGLLTLTGSYGVRNPHFFGDGDFLLTGNITAPATYRNLVKEGFGTLTLTGATNSIDSATTITGGTLQIGNGGATGTPGTAPITNNSILIFNRDGALTVSGNMSGGGVLINRGPGVVTLTGATIGSTGGINVENGTLLINGNASTATGGINVGDGIGTAATAVLGGTGPLGGDITLDTDGALDPAGATAAGTLDAIGAISGSGTFELQLDGANGDKILVGGSLDITALKLDLSVLNAPTAPVYVIVDASSAITGAAFASVTGVPAGYALEYGYNDGSDTHNIALVQSGTPFTTWATTTNGLAGGDAAPGADPDNDGLDNAVEFVIGGQPNPANANAASNALAPTSTASGANLVFTYRRTDLSLTEPGIAINVEYGSTLSGWTVAQHGVDGVSITVTDDGFGAGVDRVEVSLPKALSPDDKLFARLKVVLP